MNISKNASNIIHTGNVGNQNTNAARAARKEYYARITTKGVRGGAEWTEVKTPKAPKARPVRQPKSVSNDTSRMSAEDKAAFIAQYNAAK